LTKKKPVELGEQSGIYSVMLQKSGVKHLNLLQFLEEQGEIL
jgi:hypothetical protein